MSGEVGPGFRLGSLYVLDRRIGGGSMGTVWSAHHTETNAPVAVKILSENLAQDPDLVGRFLRERSALISVRHPHLVEVLDLVVENDRIALVMELVQGVDAARLLEQNGPMPLSQATRLGAEISEALVAVHGAGIVHRDLKPANILIESTTGAAKLVDFGIAWIAGKPRVTAADSLIGTPHYLAPELLAGGAVSPAVDVYALGVCLYQLISGVVPFDGEHYAEVLRKHLYEAPQPHPAIPPTLWSLIEAMLAKDPAARPAMPFLAAQLAMFARIEAPLQMPQEPVAVPATGETQAADPQPMQQPDSPLYSSVPPPFGEYQVPPASDSWHGATVPPSSMPTGYGTPPPFTYAAPQEDRRRSKRLLVIAAICVAVLAGIGVGAWALTGGGGGNKPQASGTASASAPASSAPPVAPKLVTHHWKLCCGGLQEDAGTTSATNNGVLLNDTKSGDAVFNGKAETQIVVDSPVIDTSQSFTMAFWMHLQGKTTTPSGRETVVEQRGTEGCAACVEFDPYSKRLAFEMQTADTPSPGTTKVEAVAESTGANWYRVIASYDAQAHTMSLYLDGVLQGTKTFDAKWAPTGPLSFGSGLQKGVTTNWYAGSLADMWIWNRAMTPGEVDQAVK